MCLAFTVALVFPFLQGSAIEQRDSQGYEVPVSTVNPHEYASIDTLEQDASLGDPTASLVVPRRPAVHSPPPVLKRVRSRRLAHRPFSLYDALADASDTDNEEEHDDVTPDGGSAKCVARPEASLPATSVTARLRQKLGRIPNSAVDIIRRFGQARETPAQSDIFGDDSLRSVAISGCNGGAMFLGNSEALESISTSPSPPVDLSAAEASIKLGVSSMLRRATASISRVRQTKGRAGASKETSRLKTCSVHTNEILTSYSLEKAGYLEKQGFRLVCSQPLPTFL